MYWLAVLVLRTLRTTRGHVVFKVQDGNFALESGLGRHHLHDLFGGVSARVDIVHAYNQISRENVAFQTASLFHRMHGRTVFGRVNYNLEFARRGIAVAANNGLVEINVPRVNARLTRRVARTIHLTSSLMVWPSSRDAKDRESLGLIAPRCREEGLSS